MEEIPSITQRKTFWIFFGLNCVFEWEIQFLVKKSITFYGVNFGIYQHSSSISIIHPSSSKCAKEVRLLCSIHPTSCELQETYTISWHYMYFDGILWTCSLGTFPLGTCCITVCYTPSYCTFLRCVALSSNCDQLQRTVSLFCPPSNGRQSASHKTEGNSLAN